MSVAGRSITSVSRRGAKAQRKISKKAKRRGLGFPRSFLVLPLLCAFAPLRELEDQRSRDSPQFLPRRAISSPPTRFSSRSICVSRRPSGGEFPENADFRNSL